MLESTQVQNRFVGMTHSIVVDDYSRIFSDCKNLIAEGDDYGYLLLADFYFRFDLKPEDEEEVIALLEEGQNKIADNQAIYHALGNAYARGIGCIKNLFRSHQYFETILDANIPDVLVAYGNQCLLGLGCFQDIPQGMKYLSLAKSLTQTMHS